MIISIVESPIKTNLTRTLARPTTNPWVTTITFSGVMAAAASTVKSFLYTFVYNSVLNEETVSLTDGILTAATVLNNSKLLNMTASYSPNIFVLLSSGDSQIDI